jgi:hypothetical protein
MVRLEMISEVSVEVETEEGKVSTERKGEGLSEGVSPEGAPSEEVRLVVVAEVHLEEVRLEAARRAEAPGDPPALLGTVEAEAVDGHLPETVCRTVMAVSSDPIPSKKTTITMSVAVADGIRWCIVLGRKGFRARRRLGSTGRASLSKVF